LFHESQKTGRNNTLTFITTNTIRNGKVFVLISVDNYSRYCFGVAVEKEMPLQVLCKQIESILRTINDKHPTTTPLFILA
jgi:hypothetical protein